MSTHDNAADKLDKVRELIAIPGPRKALDADVENGPQTGRGQPVWWYYQKRKRGCGRSYSGYVKNIQGAEGERLRGELADVIGDLLGWAARHQIGNQSTEEGEAA